jgi:hypothetical protein
MVFLVVYICVLNCFDRLMIDLFGAAKRRRNVLRLAVVYIDSA